MFILKLLKYLLILVVVLFFVFQIRFMPSYESKLNYKGINISINRDVDFNIPTIKGDSKLAALYGLGYATAEDRLFQMHMKRMVGKGRLAQMVGQRGVNLDIFFRQLGVNHISQQACNKMRVQDPVAFQGYQAYAQGVNDYVKSKGLGIEFYALWTGFEPWEVVDTFVVTKLVDWVQSADGGLTVVRQILAQQIGKEQTEKMLGWKQQHFLFPNQVLIVSPQELKFSSQFRGEQQQEIEQVQTKNENTVYQNIQSQQVQQQQTHKSQVAQQQKQQQEQQEQHQQQEQQQIKQPQQPEQQAQQQLESQQIQQLHQLQQLQQLQEQQKQQMHQQQIKQQQSSSNKVEELQSQEIQNSKTAQQSIQISTQPAELVQLTQPVQPAQPIQLVQSVQPVQPVQSIPLQPKNVQDIQQEKNKQQIKNNQIIKQKSNSNSRQKRQKTKKPSTKTVQVNNVHTINNQNTDNSTKQPKKIQLTNIQLQQIPLTDPQQLINQQNTNNNQKQSSNNPKVEVINPQAIHLIGRQKFEQIDPELLNAVNGGGGASNSWVISGKHTASGRPILANDPHLASVIPSDWFQAEIRYPVQQKQVSLRGVFIAGSSLSSLIAKTQYFAWGCTTQYKDTQDLYKQRVEGNRYLVDGEWRQLEQRQERIRVKNGNDIILTVSKTHRGPLLSKIIFMEKLIEIPGNVSFAWTGLNTKYSFFSYLHNIAQLDSVESTADFFAQLDDGPALNLVYITRDDHIGYQTISGVPKRKGKQSPFFFDGTTTQNDWDGLVSKDQKLSLVDPPKGFIITANSRPSNSHFKGSSIYDTNFQMTARQYRIHELIQNKINSGEKLTIQDSKDFQLDQIDKYCQYILPSLKQLDRRFIKIFEGWLCQFSTTSHQASIYESFLLKLQFKFHPDKSLHIFGFLHFNHYTYKYIMQAAETEDPLKTQLISQSLSEALMLLEDRFKTNNQEDWHWGKLHLTHYSHLPFSNSPLKQFFDRYHSSGGSLNTPKMGKMTKLNQQNFNCQHHAALRMVLSYAPGQSQWVIDTGEASYPFSNHYDDQQLLHKDGKYIKFDSENSTLNQEL